VTGGLRGITAAIARPLAADGLSVLVNYYTDHQAAQQVFDDIVGQGGRAVAAAADVADAGQMKVCPRSSGMSGASLEDRPA
jgi:3-oxoacyl-[acyl-carrier protein] reductase